MKKLVLVFIVMILAGCAGTMPEKADLNIEIANQLTEVYPTSLDISVVGQDKRADPHIIVFKVDDGTATTVTSRVPPQILLKESLAHGLREQGLKQGNRSNITATIVIKELLAKVTKPGVLYSTKASTRLQLIVNTNKGVLTLEYERDASKDSMTKPKLLYLETMLNEQLTDILTKILADDRVRSAIKGK
jgi:uncharacterized lipoprotein YajG